MNYTQDNLELLNSIIGSPSIDELKKARILGRKLMGSHEKGFTIDVKNNPTDYPTYHYQVNVTFRKDPRYLSKALKFQVIDIHSGKTEGEWVLNLSTNDTMDIIISLLEHISH